ncbi:aado keto reductase [Lentinula edodes]|uniref:Aado keto reductase n=1 Tax=Lentinula edodes TaxID=5353 RepID=A0A1Q3DW20_LENED|nr:aado keto reductase [Lentinula edodes]
MHFNKLVVYLFLGSVSSAVSAPVSRDVSTKTPSSKSTRGISERSNAQGAISTVESSSQLGTELTGTLSSSTQVVVPVESLAATEALDDGWVLVPRPTPGQDPAPTTSEPEHHEPHPADPTTLPEPQYSSAPGEISLGKRPKLITLLHTTVIAFIMTANIPSLTLNNGTRMPSVGLGCWMGIPGEDERVYYMCLNAIKTGYRHFDTAAGYGNEKQVGKAIRDSGIPRTEIFLTTKLPFARRLKKV